MAHVCRKTAERCFGRSAALSLARAQENLCEQQAPIMAGLYLLMLASSYWVYNKHVFQLLPTPLTPEWHRCVMQQEACYSFLVLLKWFANNLYCSKCTGQKCSLQTCIYHRSQGEFQSGQYSTF